MKTKQESVFTVDYNDFDKTVQQHFGRPEYECVAYQEWNNYSCYDFDVDGKFYDWDLPELAEWVTTGKGGPGVRVLLNKLYVDGVIQKGKYIIQVSW